MLYARPPLIPIAIKSGLPKLVSLQADPKAAYKPDYCTLKQDCEQKDAAGKGQA